MKEVKIGDKRTDNLRSKGSGNLRGLKLSENKKGSRQRQEKASLNKNENKSGPRDQHRNSTDGSDTKGKESLQVSPKESVTYTHTQKHQKPHINKGNGRNVGDKFGGLGKKKNKALFPSNHLNSVKESFIQNGPKGQLYQKLRDLDYQRNNFLEYKLNDHRMAHYIPDNMEEYYIPDNRLFIADENKLVIYIGCFGIAFIAIIALACVFLYLASLFPNFSLTKKISSYFKDERTDSTDSHHSQNSVLASTRINNPDLIKIEDYINSEQSDLDLSDDEEDIEDDEDDEGKEDTETRQNSQGIINRISSFIMRKRNGDDSSDEEMDKQNNSNNEKLDDVEKLEITGAELSVGPESVPEFYLDEGDCSSTYYYRPGT